MSPLGVVRGFGLPVAVLGDILGLMLLGVGFADVPLRVIDLLDGDAGHVCNLVVTNIRHFDLSGSIHLGERCTLSGEKG